MKKNVFYVFLTKFPQQWTRLIFNCYQCFQYLALVLIKNNNNLMFL